MGKKRKIFILSALAAGIAIFFGRKRMQSKAEDASNEGDWMPDEDAEHDEDAAPSDESASTDAESSDDSAAEDSEEESEEKAG